MPSTPIKYLINPLPAGGFPLENEDLITLQDVPRAALNAALGGLGSCFVLSGCDCYDQDTDAGVCYVNPGHIFIGGEVRYFAGNNGGAFPFYVLADTDSVTQKTFEDGNAKDTSVSLRTKIQTNRPSTGQFVTFSPNPVEKISTAITGALTTALGAETQARTTADANLNNLVATKVTKRINGTGWTDLVLNPGFTTEPSLYPGGFNKAQYLRTEDGFVHLRGKVDFNSATGGTVATLPNGFGTIGETRITTSALHGSPATELGVRVAISGPNIYFFPDTVSPATQLTVFLDGIHFYADGPGGVI